MFLKNNNKQTDDSMNHHAQCLSGGNLAFPSTQCQAFVFESIMFPKARHFTGRKGKTPIDFKLCSLLCSLELYKRSNSRKDLPSQWGQLTLINQRKLVDSTKRQLVRMQKAHSNPLRYPLIVLCPVVNKCYLLILLCMYGVFVCENRHAHMSSHATVTSDDQRTTMWSLILSCEFWGYKLRLSSFCNKHLCLLNKRASSYTKE